MSKRIQTLLEHNIFCPDLCGRGTVKPLWRERFKNLRFRYPNSLVSCGRRADPWKKLCSLTNILIRVNMALPYLYCSLRLIDLKPKIDKKSKTALKILTPNQKPIIRSEQLPCAHVTAFSRTSLFLERFWREFWISFKFHKPVSKTYRHKNNYIFCLLITFSFQFDILYFECVHRHGGDSIFLEKVPKNVPKNKLVHKSAVT